MYELPTARGLKKYRKKLKLTQVELAKRAKVSQSLIARIEAGGVDPRLSTLKKILNVMKVEEMGDICAENIMKTPVIHVHPSDTVGQASEIMDKYGISQIPVLDGDVQMGSVSEAMVIKGMDLEKDLSKVSTKKIEEIMKGGFPTVEKNAGIKTLSKLLEMDPAVLIKERGKVVGIVTKADVLKLIER